MANIDNLKDSVSDNDDKFNTGFGPSLSDEDNSKPVIKELFNYIAPDDLQ